MNIAGINYANNPEAEYGDHIKNTTAICNTSASHTYGHVMGIMEKYLLEQFPNIEFKTVTASTTLASRQLKHLPQQLHKAELPAMVLVDSVSRYVDGVLHNSDSVEDESFSDGLLEYPQYTRPQEFMGLRVPDVLLNGNHKEIAKWKQEQKILETKKYRPDLLEKLNKKD